ncbi:aromatic acid exporter family protein [Plantactinospora siamensis]|uniref:Aromatic acid exporter family protein n=1 Tax=Plantactinospora siamensis TaxID=555372 RepID=A0ABV6NY39_9ACTN
MAGQGREPDAGPDEGAAGSADLDEGASGHAGPDGRAAESYRRRVETVLSDLRRRTASTRRDRLRQLRLNGIIAVQAGVAAGLSWLVAHDLLGNTRPVFAPAAAVGTIVSSVGQRLRRSVELIIGVALGVAIGDFLVGWLGAGAWQTALIVCLAVAAALVLGGRGTLVAQAGGTAVLIATLSPVVENLEVPRFVDATLGGAIGMAVVVLLLPLNPVRAVERSVRPAADVLSEQLRAASRALAERDAAAARRALEALRGIAEDFARLREALSGAREVVSLAPSRWHRRQLLAAYADGVDRLNRAALNSMGLLRRLVTLIEDREPAPPTLNLAIERQAEAVRHLRRDFFEGRRPEECRRVTLLAVAEAAVACETGLGLSGTAAVAQIRTVASDLLQATGLPEGEANALVHRVAARTVEFGPAQERPGAAVTERPARQ